MNPEESQQRELVFCHACENEWYKDEHGLTCPDCQGEFTEIVRPTKPTSSASAPEAHLQQIERDHDPRAADPDEDDIDLVAPGQHPESRSPQDLPQNIFSTFNSIFTAGGTRDFMNQNRPGREPHAGNQQGGTPPPGQPRVQMWTNAGPGFSFSARSTTYNNGGEDEERQMGQADLGRMLVDLIGSIQGHGGSQVGPDGFPRFGTAPMGVGGGGVFGELMNNVLGMHGNPGDYVTNQEAFDRMMSQLMDDNQQGSAPGPASSEAIASLEKKPATSDILGGQTADCSICMLETNAGDDITILPCGHWYHPDCIGAWLSQHDTCAICRKGITPLDGDANTVRSPTQDPLHDHDPAQLARRESHTGTRDDPIWVPESPSQARRTRRPSNSAGRPGSSQQFSASSPGGASNVSTPRSPGSGRRMATAFRNLFHRNRPRVGSGAGGEASGLTVAAADVDSDGEAEAPDHDIAVRRTLIFAPSRSPEPPRPWQQ